MKSLPIGTPQVCGDKNSTTTRIKRRDIYDVVVSPASSLSNNNNNRDDDINNNN